MEQPTCGGYFEGFLNSISLKRRSFLKHTLSASVLLAHEGWLGMGCMAAAPSGKSNDRHLIQSLDLKTSAPIKDLLSFYGKSLELPILRQHEKSFTFLAGNTEITFTQSIRENAPFYHFAFNIPENKIEAARQWQLERTPLIATPPHMIDPNFPDDIRHFRHWNAHSVFFLDPAGNLLEYIARHDLSNAREGHFSAKDILYASEIALIVDDVDATSKQIKDRFSLQQYRQGSDRFRAIGDEKGLLLVMKTGRQWPGAERPAGIYNTAVTINRPQPADLLLKGYPYHIGG